MPAVTAVSVSTPRLIEIRGQSVLTSIVRDPLAGPLFFGLGGPAGNRTAVHSEDVLVTVRENYDYWTSELGVARAAWPDCFWGENLTIAGLDERTLRIGDRLAIGATALFQVTSPRIPCFKLAWRLGQPDAFLRTLVASGRTGFYLRVLRAGEVSAGSAVLVESPYPENLTVSEVSRLLHDDTATPELLERALAMAGLGRQALAMLRNRLTQLTDGLRCRPGRWSGWRQFEIFDIRRETLEVRSFKVRPKDGRETAQFRAGQFITVRVPIADGRTVSRVWSISDYDEQGLGYRLTIRRSQNGRASSHMHDAVRTGDTLELRSPAGAFALDRSTVFRTVLISAGIGVTPMIAMLKAHARRDDPPPLLWIHSTQNSATHVLREEAASVLDTRPQFRSHIVYTAPRQSDTLGIDYHDAGRLTQERIRQLLGVNYQCRPFGREIELPSQAGQFYICGPAPFEQHVRDALKGFGVDEAAIFSEHFQRFLNDESRIDECQVVFSRSSKAALWRAEDDTSLLELAEEHDVAASFSCRAGSCHSCETALLKGAVSYQMQPPIPPRPGCVLLCCARPSSPIVELDV